MSRHRQIIFALGLLIATLRLVYLAYFCPLDLAADEAYYWDWSRQLDWSYHSKGPLVAWLIRLSCEIFGDTVLAVRLPAVVCGSLLLLGLFTLTAEVQRKSRPAFGMVALALALPIVAAGSMLMTIDAPFLCAWMWGLVFAQRALFQGSKWAWPAAGLCLSLGILAKPTMLLWALSFVLFLITTPVFRGQLRRAGFWIMLGIGASGGIPLLIWNAVNGWAMLKHTQMHAGFDEDLGIRWLGPLQYLGAQCAILLGFWFALWLIAMWRHRPSVEANPQARFLWWMAAPTFIFFCLFAFKNGGGEPNWPLPAYLAGMVLVVGVRSQESGVRSQESGVGGRWLQAGGVGCALIGVMVTALLHVPMSVQPVLLRIAGPATKEQPAPLRRVDPTCRLRGWRLLAAEVDRACAELRGRGIEPLIVGERWTLAAQLAFYCENQPRTVCIGKALGDRDCQYDLWRPNPVVDPRAFHGRTFVIVGFDLQRLQSAFRVMEPIRTVAYRENGELIADWTIAIAHDFRGWDQGHARR